MLQGILDSVIHRQIMSSPSTQFATSGRMGIYTPLHQVSMWGESFKGDGSPHTAMSSIVEIDVKYDSKVHSLQFDQLKFTERRYHILLLAILYLTSPVHLVQSEDTSQGSQGHSRKFDQEASKTPEKVNEFHY